MENRDTQNLAARIAALLQENEQGSGDDLLRASLEKIDRRLDKIEARLDFHSPNPQSAIRNPQSVHASQEKFKSLEELADEIIANLEEKACPYEPTAKPCDHCAMCSSRGF